MIFRELVQGFNFELIYVKKSLKNGIAVTTLEFHGLYFNQLDS